MIFMKFLTQHVKTTNQTTAESILDHRTMCTMLLKTYTIRYDTLFALKN